MANSKVSSEKKLQDIIDGLLERGKKNGTLSYKEVADKLYNVDIDKDQVEDLYDLFIANGIEIVSDSEKGKTEEEASDGSADKKGKKIRELRGDYVQGHSRRRSCKDVP